VLQDGDDRDPVSEAVRSLLDGHVALSDRLAEEGRFPAVDVLRSASRTMPSVAHDFHLRAAQSLRRALAMLDRIADARALGVATIEDSARAAIAIEDRLEAFLRQGSGASQCDATLAELEEIARSWSEGLGHR
jgi:flagellar biosynthesis/type III secretory pathway ATPase